MQLKNSLASKNRFHALIASGLNPTPDLNLFGNLIMKQKDRQLYRLAGIILALLAVVLGAFGAHALKDTLVAKESVYVWETAVRYQMWHALALLLLSVFPKEQSPSKATGQCLIIGTLLFSGSLYLLAIGGPRWLGPITPIGGILLIIGWLLLLLSTCKNYRSLTKN